MGLDCPNIDLVIMVRPYSMIHSLVQACGRGGRKMMDNFRRRVVFMLLFNNSDISENDGVLWHGWQGGRKLVLLYL